MKCSRCGKTIGGRLYEINGAILCEDCASAIGADKMLDGMRNEALRMFGGDIAATMLPLMNEIEFSPSRTQIKCPKCGQTLRDIETDAMLGCIECYNTFNETIMKSLMRSQANTQYKGRKPGQDADFIAKLIDDSTEAVSDVNNEIKNEVQDDSTTASNVANIKADAKPTESISSAKTSTVATTKLDKLLNADLGMLSENDLKEAIKLCVEKENYIAATKFRDELKSREEKQ